MEPMTIISQSLTAGGLTGARPALTLFLMQLYSLFLSDNALPEKLHWINNQYVVAAVGVFVIVEHFARTDPDFEEIMQLPNAIIGVAVALTGALLLTGLGQDPALWQEVASTDTNPLLWTAGASGEHSTLTISMVVSAFASLGMGWLRKSFMNALDSMALPTRWWRWVETGGVVGLIAMVLALPFLALTLTIVLFVTASAAAATVWFIQKSRDEKKRIPCPNPSCDFTPREEAHLCPSCKTPLGASSPSKGLATT